MCSSQSPPNLNLTHCSLLNCLKPSLIYKTSPWPLVFSPQEYVSGSFLQLAVCIHHTLHHLQWICILLCVQAECWRLLWHELAVPRPSCEELHQLHFCYGSDFPSAVFHTTFVPAQTLTSGYRCLLQRNFIITHYSAPFHSHLPFPWLSHIDFLW